MIKVVQNHTRSSKKKKKKVVGPKNDVNIQCNQTTNEAMNLNIDEKKLNCFRTLLL